MADIYSRFKKPKRDVTPTGHKEKVIFGIKYEDDGTKTVVVKGMENVYDKAQEGKELCDINNIVKRYTNGDPFALNKTKAVYGDFVDTPKDIVSAMQIIRDAKEAFMKLPIEVREAYNHDPEQFLADAGSPKFKKLMEVKEKEIETLETIKEDEK